MINYLRGHSELERFQIWINYLLSVLLGAVLMYAVITFVTLPAVEEQMQMQREYYNNRYNSMVDSLNAELEQRERYLINEIHRAQRGKK